LPSDRPDIVSAGTCLPTVTKQRRFLSRSFHSNGTTSYNIESLLQFVFALWCISANFPLMVNFFLQ
jgi:hypothetical protein